MTQFLRIDDEGDQSILVNVDQVIAFRCQNHCDGNGIITMVVRDWDVCEKHEMVDFNSHAGADARVWWNEFSVIMEGDEATALAALTEALNTPGAVVDLRGIADKHGEEWWARTCPTPAV